MTINKKQAIAIAVVVAAGALAAALILGRGKADHESHAEQEHAEAADPGKGPHGGRYFAQDGYGLEVSIFEQGVEPQWRLYAYKDGKPVAPAASKVVLTLERLGRAPEKFAFVGEKDYLKSGAVVAEPHSFKVGIVAQHGGKTYRFAYEQVEARIAMTAQQLKQNGVEIQTAGPARIRSALQLIGEIRLNEERMVHIVPRLAGVVQSVGVNAGDYVRKGQLLAVISSQTLADQRSDLLTARKRVGLARTVFEREQALWKEKISAEQDYLQARNAFNEAEISLQAAQQKLASLGAGAGAPADLARYEIRSPIAGTVTEKHIAIGQALKDDSGIFVVADLSTVWADMTVPAKDVNSVKVGQKASVKSGAFDASAAGAISYVGVLVGEQTRSAVARIVLPNPDGSWRPGLPVSVELVAQETDVALAVATGAIQTLKDAPAVFGRYGDVFEARPVQLGRSDGKFTEVLQGLNAGELYAAKNSFLIKADLGKADASHEH